MHGQLMDVLIFPDCVRSGDSYEKKERLMQNR